MPTVSRPNTYTDGASTNAAEATANETTLYNLVNGALDKDNLSATANIADTQLAQIATASKVKGAALTVLSGIPSGAGQIPVANLGTGSPSASTFLIGDGSWGSVSSGGLPAGSVIQVVNVIVTSAVTCSTALPQDDTIPQKTEGDEVMTLAITPTSATNKLLIQVFCNIGSLSGTNPYCSAALFQDTTANALAAAIGPGGSTGSALNANGTISFSHYMTSGTTSATTFKVRVGPIAGTAYVNGNSGGRYFGGVCASSITITEVKV